MEQTFGSNPLILIGWIYIGHQGGLWSAYLTTKGEEGDKDGISRGEMCFFSVTYI